MLVVDCRMLHASGIGTYIKNLLPSLFAEKRFTLSILHYPQDRQDLLAYGHANLISMEAPIYSIKEQWELARKIPPSTLFWSPHFNVPLLPIRAKHRLVTIHDVYHLAHPLPFRQKVYAHVFYNGAALLSDQMITVSEFSKQEIYKYFKIKPKQLMTILHGIPLARFAPPSQEKLEEVRKKYHLPPLFILGVGNVKPNKNLPALIKAFKSLSLREHLVIVGKKEGFITGEKELTSEKNIHFIQGVKDSDIPSFYHLASLFVFPSLYEGFGFPPLEAMASNCPVICSRKASLPEVCGSGVLYVDSTNIDEMKREILSILSSETKQNDLKKRGQLHVQNWDQKRSIAPHLDLIRSFF